MTSKRDKKGEPKAAKRPKLKKEKLRDLDAREGEGVRGGGYNDTAKCLAPTHGTNKGGS